MLKRFLVPVFALARRLKIAVQEDEALNRQTRRHIDLVSFIQASHISVGSRVLDVGSGPGWLAERLYTAGFHQIAACDWLPREKLSPAASAQMVYTRIDLNVDGLSVYPEQSFDLIVCSDVIEHLENPARMLREFERVLAPGGHVFLTIPNAFNLFERYHILRTGNSLRYRNEQHADTFGHISMLPYWVLQSICARAGLEILSKSGGYCWWEEHFWFPNRKLSHLLSYKCQYHLRRKADHADKELPR